ncbi:Copper chaperone CopZ [Flaviramulus basaltis]|uniref:Copper chaperone CopZ n=1 Tax=Flaviramulus basaltis TaxID=369401 RepID=A0A1K2IJD3_9FLAO|nr:heavy-metal-associated domain-containing protein [Flaviramulus basaltis]SFZ92386.1 Copper chaperone CopZ [Flaviramulus basaltis]
MKTILKIQNLKCGGCANIITNKLSDSENISDVTVDNENDTVSFSYINEDDLLNTKTTLTKLGYPVIGDKYALTTKAKSLVSCALGRLNN